MLLDKDCGRLNPDWGRIKKEGKFVPTKDGLKPENLNQDESWLGIFQ